MIIGIAIPSFIAVLGGIFTYGYVNDVKNRQGIVQVADDLKEQVLEIRRNSKNFLHYKEEGQLQGLNSAISVFSESLVIIPLEASVGIGMEKVALLKESIENFSDLVDELKVNFRNETDITKKVREEGRRLEKLVATKKLAKELSTSFVLRLRLLEKDYMLLHDNNSYRELSKALSQTKNIIPFCYDCTPYIDAVYGLFGVQKQIDSLTDRLLTIEDRMEEITREASGLQRQKINSFITRTQKFLLAALILLCTLGPLFVYKTSSVIAAPIKRLAETARRISKGDINLRAELKEQDETHSLAVSFNTMLDNLQETQQSLKESLELLNEKQAQLVESEKRASMGFLVAGVAHEINNPLNNISLRAEVVKEEVKGYANERLNSYVNDIIMQSERAHNIVNNLLDFARARKYVGMEKLDIVGVVNDSINLVANQLIVNNIKLEMDLPESAYYVNGNKSKLEQVLISIITNAIQAMGDSGRLSVSVAPDMNSGMVLTKISDTGKGIPDDDLKNIFEPFFTTKSPGEGTGLGLAVSHTLVKEHNGEIGVESRVGSGTTFTIRLPLID